MPALTQARLSCVKHVHASVDMAPDTLVILSGAKDLARE